jgi:hypothetical protein
MPTLPALRCLLLACALLSPAADAVSPVLDARFGADGLRLLPEAGGALRGLGSCPHADGSITLLGHRASSTGIVSVRLRPDGSLERGYSGDGMAETPIYIALDPARAGLACAGTGNADPGDDRAMIVAASPGTNDTAVLVMLDLHSGGFDADFGLGGPMVHDYAGLLFPQAGEGPHYPRLDVQGVQAGIGGEWLVAGRLDGSALGETRGFIARITPLGAIAALAPPVAPGYRTLGLNVSRVGLDGSIRALGTLRDAGSGTDTWGLLRLDPQTLAFQSLPDVGVASGNYFEVLGGRRIGSGLLVAAALQGDGSAFGTGPRLLVVREDTVSETVLPQPPLLEGEVVGVMDGSAAGASGNRVVFAGGLLSGTRVGVGYYVSMLQLGDGNGVPDTVFTQYGSGGAGAFRFRGAAPGCAVGQPYQVFANISSWGDATLLVGESLPVCNDQNAPGEMLAARLATAATGVFAHGFER